MKVVLTAAARRDIREPSAYYEAARDGLGLESLDRIEDGIDKIAANPLAHRKVLGETRRYLLEKFPCALWFRVEKKV